MSLNGRLNVNYDVSLNSRLFVGSDASCNANMYVLGRTIIQGDVSMNSRLFINGDVSLNNRLFVSSNTASTTTSTGALTVAGGVGIGGALFTGSTFKVGGASTLVGAVSVTNSSASTTTSSGALTVTGGVGIGGAVFTGSTLNVAGASTLAGAASVTNTTVSTTTSSGALTVAGGVGIGGAVFTGSTLNVAGASTHTGAASFSSTVNITGASTLTGAVSVTNNTASTSISTGAITVAGGIGVAGTVNATTFNIPSDYRIKDNVINLTNNYVVDDLIPVQYYNTLIKKPDIGLIAHQLQEHYPHLVSGVKDGIEHQTVNYTGLIPVLINEIHNIKKNKINNIFIEPSSNLLIFDCSKNSTFYFKNVSETNFTANFINIPKVENTVYSTSIIIDISDFKTYVDNVTVNGNNCMLYFKNDNIQTNKISKFINQKFTFVRNNNNETNFVLSKITEYK
jgi:hypothetical protein